MKLSKDQIQKAALGGMLIVGLVYSYFEFLLGPLSKGREQATKDTEELIPKIAAARAQIAKTTAIEEKAPAALAVVEQVKAMIPQGSPIAWVPTKITDLLKREGVEKSGARQSGEVAEKDLTGFTKFAWAIEVPRVEFITFARALSVFENEEPLMEIQTLEIEAGKENPQFQRASFTLHTIVRQ